MHYFLYVRLPRFYVGEWERRDSERAAEPIAVHRDKRVLDVNAAAAEAGLRTGMGVEEAKALLQGQGLIAWEEEPYREAQAAWLDRLADFSGTIEPDGQDAAWADLTGHPDVLATAGEIRGLLGEVRLGVAGVKWLAKLAAEVHGDLPPAAWELAMREGLESPAAMVAPLPVQLLAPVEPAHRERLRFLGYRTIGEVASVPMRTMREPFGGAAQTILAAAKGGFAEPVLSLYPPDAVVARMRFEGGLDDAEALRRALAELSRRIATAMAKRDAQGATVEVEIELEDQSLERKRTFSRPIRSAREVAAALRLTVGEIVCAVHGLRVRMPRLEKARERQASLYAVRSPGDEAAADVAIAGLRRTFGDGSIVRASDRPTPRRVRVLRAWSHATGWK